MLWLRMLILICGCCLLLPLAAPPVQAAGTVSLPLTLDYNFLRSAMVRQFFSTPGGKALAASDGDGCTKVELWDPVLGHENGRLAVRVRARIRAGVTILGRCLDPIDWQGGVVLLQEAAIAPDSWRLKVRTVDSRALDSQGQPAQVAGVVWRLIKNQVHAYLDQFQVDLTPPVNELEGLLPMVYAPERSARVRAWLKTMRPGPVTVGPQAVRAQVLMDVDQPKPEPSPPPEPLSPEQRQAFIEYWQHWDMFLVHQMLALSGYRLSPAERSVLLATLVEQRLGFVRALEGPVDGVDLVRRQFLDTWQNLAPILRRHLLEKPSPSLFSFLSFITATDALVALDQLGPAFNLDISSAGLRRLARLVDRGGAALPQNYTWGVNPGLRTLLGLGPPLPQPAPHYDPRRLEPPGGRKRPSWLGFNLLDMLNPKAWAREPASPPLANISRFTPSGPDLPKYMTRVMGVLSRAVAETLRGSKLTPAQKSLFGLLAPACAWQESCWRQFQVKDGKLSVLVSYNNTSVGLMQINERVWRGLYQPHYLRWDINYNAAAGCQILHTYLVRYALPYQKQWPPDTLARAVYAMYNGGPRQLKRFLKRHKAGKYYLSDRLFWEKLKKVKAGEPRGVPSCLR